MNVMNNMIISKMREMIEMKKILTIVVELLNNGFVIYGDFCRKILNNQCNNVIDIYCTTYQYIYFGNISLNEMDDKMLCMEFVKYLQIIFKNFEDVFVNVKIMKNKYHRYIICYYDKIQINIEINDDIIDQHFLCNSLRIRKKNNIKILTTDDFLKFIFLNGSSDYLEFSIKNLYDISISNIIKCVKLKIAICLHKYKKYNDKISRARNKIIFDQTFFCYKISTCKNNSLICNKKHKESSKNNKNINKLDDGLCPCEMNTFIREFIKINNDGYSVFLVDKSYLMHIINNFSSDIIRDYNIENYMSLFTTNLKINYSDVIWPLYHMNNLKQYSLKNVMTYYNSVVVDLCKKSKQNPQCLQVLKESFAGDGCGYDACISSNNGFPGSLERGRSASNNLTLLSSPQHSLSMTSSLAENIPIDIDVKISREEMSDNNHEEVIKKDTNGKLLVVPIKYKKSKFKKENLDFSVKSIQNDEYSQSGLNLKRKDSLPAQHYPLGNSEKSTNDNSIESKNKSKITLSLAKNQNFTNKIIKFKKNIRKNISVESISSMDSLSSVGTSSSDILLDELLNGNKKYVGINYKKDISTPLLSTPHSPLIFPSVDELIYDKC